MTDTLTDPPTPSLAVTSTTTSSGPPASTSTVVTGKKNTRGDVLAYAAIAFMFFIVVVLLFVPMNQFMHDILLVIIGAMVGINKDVYAFEFGSSRGSEAKTDQISTMIAEKPTGQTT